MPLDERLFRSIYPGPSGSGPSGSLNAALTLTMLAFTMIGSGWSMFAFVPWLVAARSRAFTSALLATLAVNAAFVATLKALVGRVRPFAALNVAPLVASAPKDPSFPSGHAAGSFAFAAFVVVALARAKSPVRADVRVMAFASVPVAALVAVSRVYLGVHYPVDVAAGALFGSLMGATGAYLHAWRSEGAAPALKVAPSPLDDADRVQ
jgi:undecaprenyl-diphosphatase